MSVFLFTSVALVAALLVATSYFWLLLLPGLGIRALYHRREWSFAFTILAVTLAVVVAGTAPARVHMPLIAAVALLLAAGEVLKPPRVLPALDDPRSDDGPSIPPDELVLAAVANNTDRGWPVSLLALHHVINDEVGGEPVVATW